jgi:hypothetical protein
VIANAGTIGGNALAHEISENDWQTTLGINADVEPTLSDLAALKSNPLLDPGDIANAVLWLASDEAAFVAGVTLPSTWGPACNDTPGSASPPTCPPRGSR